MAARLEKATGSRYLAGHFEHQLIPSLLWRSSQWSPPRPPHDDVLIPVPSWSWASRHDIIVFQKELLESTPISRYIGYNVVTAPKDQYHDRSAGLQLQLSGFTWQIGHTGIDLLQADTNTPSVHGGYRALLGFGNLGDVHQRSITVEDEADWNSWRGFLAALPEQHQVLELYFTLDERLASVPDHRQGLCSSSSSSAVARNLTSDERWTDLTDRFMAPTPIFLLFMVLFEPGPWRRRFVGLVLERVADAEENVPVCRRLGTFRTRNLDEFGMAGEGLAQQVKNMKQSMMYLV